MPRPKRPVRKPRVKRPPRKRTKVTPWRAIKKANRRREPSSLEKKVYAMLEAEGIPFVREKAIGRLHADVFIAPNIVIECAGCHWHGCTVCNRNPTTEQRAAIIKDGRREFVLRKKGYDVITVWEHEVNNHPERVQVMSRGIFFDARGRRHCAKRSTSDPLAGNASRHLLCRPTPSCAIIHEEVVVDTRRS